MPIFVFPKTKIMRTLILLLLAGSLWAESEISLQAPVKKVQIFQTGATLYREAKLQLAAGQHDLYFGGLSLGLDPNTIQLYGNKGLEVISFKIKNQAFTEEEAPEEYRSLLKKLNQKKEAIADIEAELEALKMEKALLDENKNIGGSQGYSMGQLEAIIRYAKTQIQANAKQQFSLNTKKQSLQNEIRQQANELNRLKQKYNQLQSGIVVTVRTDKALNTSIGLSYSYRNNFSWSPNYRMEFKSLEDQLAVDQLAVIYQNSGEDLKNVEITLSTGSPSDNNQIPRLETNFINLYTPNENFKRAAYNNAEPQMLDEVSVVEGVQVSQNKIFSGQLASTGLMETRQDFKLKGKYNLPQAKEEIVAIQSFSIKADYHYESVPKLDPSVYLMARLKDYESLELIPGKVSVFNQGAYNGSFFSDFKSLDDGFTLSLGKDQSFAISYERVFNEERGTFFGSSKVELYHYRIKVKPSKANGNKLIIKDQIPISQNSDLKVRLIDGHQANFDEESGFLSWEMELLNSGPKQIDFKYELRYPSDKRIR